MRNGTPFFTITSLICICFAVFPLLSWGQTYGPLEDRILTIRQNSNSTLEASNKSVWIGPGLNAFDEMTGEIYVPTNADSVFNGPGRAFSLEVQNDRILAGLGFTSSTGGSSVNAALGYYHSTNAGENWTFIPFLLDEKAELQPVMLPLSGHRVILNSNTEMRHIFERELPYPSNPHLTKLIFMSRRFSP